MGKQYYTYRLMVILKDTDKTTYKSTNGYIRDIKSQASKIRKEFKGRIETMLVGKYEIEYLNYGKKVLIAENAEEILKWDFSKTINQPKWIKLNNNEKQEEIRNFLLALDNYKQTKTQERCKRELQKPKRKQSEMQRTDEE